MEGSFELDFEDRLVPRVRSMSDADGMDAIAEWLEQQRDSETFLSHIRGVAVTNGEMLEHLRGRTLEGVTFIQIWRLLEMGNEQVTRYLPEDHGGVADVKLALSGVVDSLAGAAGSVKDIIGMVFDRVGLVHLDDDGDLLVDIPD
jgi:hypothetical protein